MRPCVSRLFACTLLAVAISGCSSMHVKRAAYQMLRQGDCRLNQLDEFCNRNFTADYHAYERLRQDFLRERARPADTTASDSLGATDRAPTPSRSRFNG